MPSRSHSDTCPSRVGADTPRAKIERDWTLTHEFFHLAWPSREGVHPSTLGWWRCELARRDGDQKQPVVALTRVMVTPTVGTAALEVVVVRRSVVAVALALVACGGGEGDDPPGDDVDASAGDPDGPPGAPDARPDARRPADAVPHSDAPTGLRVFVTSLRYPANLRDAGGGATGRESADAICQTLADAAVLDGTFRAWLSTTDQDAIDAIGGTGPWYRMDGLLAFPNHASLATTPVNAIAVDEQGGHPDPFYESWTGTAVGGHLAPPGSRLSINCWDWTSTVDSTQVGGLVGVYGDVGNPDDGEGPEWTGRPGYDGNRQPAILS